MENQCRTFTIKTKLFKSFSSLVLSKVGAPDGTTIVFCEMLTLWGMGGEGGTLRRAPVTKRREIGSCPERWSEGICLWVALVHLSVPTHPGRCILNYWGFITWTVLLRGTQRSGTARGAGGQQRLQDFHVGGVLGLHPLRSCKMFRSLFCSYFFSQKGSLHSDLYLYYKSLNVAKLYLKMF